MAVLDRPSVSQASKPRGCGDRWCWCQLKTTSHGLLKLRWSYLSLLREVILSAEEETMTLALSHFRRRDLHIADKTHHFRASS